MSITGLRAVLTVLTKRMVQFGRAIGRIEDRPLIEAGQLPVSAPRFAFDGIAYSTRLKRVSFFPFCVNPSTARCPKPALLTRSRLQTSLDAQRGRSRAAGCPTGESPAQLLAQMCDWPARSSQSRHNCRQNGLRQKLILQAASNGSPRPGHFRKYFSFVFSEIGVS